MDVLGPMEQIGRNRALRGDGESEVGEGSVGERSKWGDGEIWDTKPLGVICTPGWDRSVWDDVDLGGTERNQGKWGTAGTWW